MQLERCPTMLGDLQEILDGDPRKFGEGYEDATVREVVEAWEAVNALPVDVDVVSEVDQLCGVPILAAVPVLCRRTSLPTGRTGL